jgi:alpha-N-arabinofuranosidase
MDELVSGHLQIMHRHDPQHRVGLIVDEWGTWYDVEPGTNPGFLFQQNTMRDAMVAAITLNIFNRHADRIVMANIAQTVNVLQAMILTEDEKMVLTPTYHVFDLFKHHREGTLVSCQFAEKEKLSVSASVSDNTLHMTLANPSADANLPLEIALEGMAVASVCAKILTGKINAHNRFHEPENVKIVPFADTRMENGTVRLTMPPCSVMSLQIQ